jgi:hypothetical protein
MPDFAAAPLQPIVSGLVTFAGGAWSFSGKGCFPQVAHPGAGIFDLGLDPGLI